MKAIIVAADRAASYCYRMKVRQHLSLDYSEHNRTSAGSAFHTVKLNSVPGKKAIIVTADRAASYCYRTKFRQLFERNRTVAASAFRTVKLNSVPGNESYYRGRRPCRIVLLPYESSPTFKPGL
jgi:hypothetical protein